MPITRINIEEYRYKGKCIYIIRNLTNNKIYIGSTKNYRTRMNEHRNDLLKGVHPNKHLQRSFDKGNQFEFSILEKVGNEDLIEKERYYCSMYNSHDKNIGYNIAEPSKPPLFIMTNEHKLKLAEARRKRGYDTSHLRTNDSVKRAAEGKYKKIDIYKDGIFFGEAESMIHAEQLSGVKRQHVSRICRGIRKNAKGFQFKYKEVTCL